MEIVEFKSADPFYEKELSGLKNNTVRFDDKKERFDILREFKKGDELGIVITDPKTGFSFSRHVRDVSIYNEIFIITWEG